MREKENTIEFSGQELDGSPKKNNTENGRKVNPDRIYFHDVEKLSILTDEKEKELRVMLLGSPEEREKAKQELVKGCLPLVISVAKEFKSGKGRHLDLGIEEWIQIGNLVLVNASQNFNPSFENKFITYAWKSVENAMKGEVEKRSRAKRKIPGKLFSLSEYSRDYESRETPIGEEVEDMGLGNAKRQSELIQANEINSILKKERQLLNNRERKVIYSYYGLGGIEGKNKTLKEIGDSLGLSRERINQIRNEALEKIRKRFNIKIEDTDSY